MTGNQTMNYHVRPQHLYSHDRTCTRSGLCRRPLRLVAFHICYHLDRASIHDISVLVIKFQCISNIFIYYGDLDLLYIVRGDDHTWHMFIMAIHGHCTLMYSGLLHYIFAVTCLDLSLYCIDEWLVFPLGSSLLHLWDGHNVFRSSCHPSNLTH